ncbi:Crp/Fnr family transcriptional regulator [Streptomyces spectabilis]|nr:Crp/Fnr family transcriptional regulator [Streptomyces spectabilis]
MDDAFTSERAGGARELSVAGLPVTVSRRLTAAARPLCVGRGAVVFGPGDPGAELFVVVHGRVRLERRAEGAREYAPALLGPGDVFGELTVFDPSPRGATARAVTAAELLALGTARLRALLAAEPDVAWHLLGLLARRLRGAHAATESLLAPDVPARLARVLLELAARFGEPAAGGTLVRHGLTQSQLALHAGVSRGSVSRVVAGFADRGLVSPRHRAVLIRDGAGLREQALRGARKDPGRGYGGNPA